MPASMGWLRSISFAMRAFSPTGPRGAGPAALDRAAARRDCLLEEVFDVSRYLGFTALVIGVLAVIVGLFLQGGGAAAVVFCSVIGGGFVLMIAGFVAWAVSAWSHRPPAATAI